MKKFLSALFLFITVLVTPTASVAADSIVGTYDGNYQVDRLSFGIRVEITEDTGTEVKGNAIFYGKICDGAFPFKGPKTGNKVILHVEGGQSGATQCDPRKYDLIIVGKRLEGTLTHNRGVSKVVLK